MDCGKFIDLLPSLLTEQLNENERKALLDHAGRCERCRPMLDPPAGLVDVVIKRTSGATCDSARSLLPGYVRGELELTDADLVTMHLSACAECAALSGAMRGLAAELPLLAELEPDDSFVGDVLARTITARPANRFERFLRNLWQRPRIALEGAYLGTVVFALIFITPASPLAGVPRKALAQATTNSVAELAPTMEQIQDRVSKGASAIWTGAGDRAHEVWNRTTTIAVKLEKDVGTFLQGFASKQGTEEENEDQGAQP